MANTFENMSVSSLGGGAVLSEDVISNVEEMKNNTEIIKNNTQKTNDLIKNLTEAFQKLSEGIESIKQTYNNQSMPEATPTEMPVAEVTEEPVLEENPVDTPIENVESQDSGIDLDILNNISASPVGEPEAAPVEEVSSPLDIENSPTEVFAPIDVNSEMQNDQVDLGISPEPVMGEVTSEINNEEVQDNNIENVDGILDAEIPAAPVEENPINFDAPTGVVEEPVLEEVTEEPVSLDVDNSLNFDIPAAPVEDVPATPEVPTVEAQPVIEETPVAPVVDVPVAPVAEVPVTPEAVTEPVVEMPTTPEVQPTVVETPVAPVAEVPVAPAVPAAPAVDNSGFISMNQLLMNEANTVAPAAAEAPVQAPIPVAPIETPAAPVAPVANTTSNVTILSVPIISAETISKSQRPIVMTESENNNLKNGYEQANGNVATAANTLVYNKAA